MLLLELRSLFSYFLSKWDASQLIESLWLEPSVSNDKFSLDIFPQKVHIINRHGKLQAYILVILSKEDLVVLVAYFVPVKAVFKCETVGYLELLPSYDSSCAYFVGFDSKTAIFVVEHVGLLS